MSAKSHIYAFNTTPDFKDFKIRILETLLTQLNRDRCNRENEDEEDMNKFLNQVNSSNNYQELINKLNPGTLFWAGETLCFRENRNAYNDTWDPGWTIEDAFYRENLTQLTMVYY